MTLDHNSAGSQVAEEPSAVQPDHFFGGAPCTLRSISVSIDFSSARRIPPTPSMGIR